MFKYLLIPFQRRRLAREAREEAEHKARAIANRAELDRRAAANKARNEAKQSPIAADHAKRKADAVLTARNAVKQAEARWVQPDDPGVRRGSSIFDLIDPALDPANQPLDPLIDPGYEFRKEGE